MMTRSLTIGAVAKEAGVSVETVRFYERQGLIAVPARPAAGYRQYGTATVARLKFIRRAKELGFTLRETSELLEIRVDPNTTCAHVKKIAQAKLLDVEAKIRDLLSIKEALTNVVAPMYRARTDCPMSDP